MCKFITKITVPRTLWGLKPLQGYIRELAAICGVAPERLLHVEMLVEELGVNIARYSLRNDPEGQIEITVLKELSSFILRFHYRGIPYGYDIDNPKDELGRISMDLIHGLSSAYSMHEDGKAGQTVEVKVALPENSLAPELERPGLLKTTEEVGLATDETYIRHIADTDMKLLVQCLYSVFGYNYSADYMYNPEALVKRRADGLYEGIVAVNSKEEVVGHVGLLKSKPDDCICECGQAFVMPQYGKRKLFTRLIQQRRDGTPVHTAGEPGTGMRGDGTGTGIHPGRCGEYDQAAGRRKTPAGDELLQADFAPPPPAAVAPGLSCRHHHRDIYPPGHRTRPAPGT